MLSAGLLRTWIQRAILRKTEKMAAKAKSPLVVVLGSTGVGKSQLAIEIAKKYGGEVISADSMQVYKGLDIITNKVTEEEMEGVPHHMLNFLDPLKEFTVVDFRNRALPIIEKLRAAGKMAVVVGGTNYYIESILWETLVSDFKNDSKDSDRLAAEDSKSVYPDQDTQSLYERLQAVDPARAQTVHPNDRRKIERALQVFEQTKTPQSKIFIEQRQRGGVLGGPLRYEDAIIFWIQCQQEVLEERLDARVDKMIEGGLIDELLTFHKDYNARRGETCDYDQGIFQSIGFKEFHLYLIASAEERESKKGKKMFEEGLWLMKQVTKRYSKYQKKWINKRFLGQPDRRVPPIYGLDGTNLAEWNVNVKDVALKVLEDIFAGNQPKLKPLESVEVKQNVLGLFNCEICGVTCVGQITYDSHMASKKHYWRKRASEKRSAEDSAGTDEVSTEGEDLQGEQQKKIMKTSA